MLDDTQLTVDPESDILTRIAAALAGGEQLRNPRRIRTYDPSKHEKTEVTLPDHVQRLFHLALNLDEEQRELHRQLQAKRQQADTIKNLLLTAINEHITSDQAEKLLDYAYTFIGEGGKVYGVPVNDEPGCDPAREMRRLIDLLKEGI